MVSSLARAEGSGASSSRLGMGTPGEAGSKEVETCREGDVVEAGVQAILMNLAEIGLLVYPRCRFSVSQIHQSCQARKTNENDRWHVPQGIRDSATATLMPGDGTTAINVESSA